MRLVYVYGCDFGGERVMIEFKGSHFERDVILWAELAKVPPAKQVEWLRRGSAGMWRTRSAIDSSRK